MDTSRLHQLAGVRARALLILLAAPLISVLAIPDTPASAATTHKLGFTASVDVKDDDVGTDDWCRGRAFRGPDTDLNHVKPQTAKTTDQTRCDEVVIVVDVAGQLMADDRVCNVAVDVYLYEGFSNEAFIDDLDGHTSWRGGTSFCIAPGQSLVWDVIRVDNTAEDAPDHGWVRNLTVTHRI